MNRRTFLKGLIAAIAAPSIAVKALAKKEQIHVYTPYMPVNVTQLLTDELMKEYNRHSHGVKWSGGVSYYKDKNINYKNATCRLIG